MKPSSPPPEPRVERALELRAIGRFFLPLMLNAWLVTLAGPVLNVVLGRSPEPRLHLAAFWIAFSILLVCQSACLVFQQVTASALGRHLPFGAVARAGALLGAGAALAVLAIAFGPAGDVVFRLVVPTPSHTAHLAREVLAILACIPVLVAVRGLACGVAVAGRRPEWLTVATLARVLVLAGGTAVVIGMRLGSGALSAAWLLVAATATEALLVSALTLSVARTRAPGAAGRRDAGSLLAVMRLALPLAGASLVWTSARPLVGAVLGRLAEPDLAQAGFGVVFPLLLLTCAPLWAFLDVAIVLPRTPADLRVVARFALLTSAAFTAGLVVMAGTPAFSLSLRAGAPLTPELARTVMPALSLLALEPLVLSARALSQGLLVRGGRAGLVLALSPVKLACMLGAGLVVVRLDPHANGAVLAIALFIGGDAVDAALFATAALRHSHAPHALGSDIGGPSLPDAGRMAA